MRNREEMLPILAGMIGGRVVSGLGTIKEVSVLGGGKKGLVFLLEGDRNRGVMRLYKDPFMLARTWRVYSLCRRAGISVPRIFRVFSGLRCWLMGSWAFTVEEWVEPWDGEDLTLLKEVAHLHDIRRFRWGGVFWGRSGGWLDRELLKARKRLNRWAEMRDQPVKVYMDCLDDGKTLVASLEEYSLVHGDLARANLGKRGGHPVLLDLDRANFSHPLTDVAALLFHFPGVETGLEEYLKEKGFSFEELRFFSYLFHIKRLNRALKHLRKGEKDWLAVVERHEEWLWSYVESRC
jgi:hypothetical protein